MSRKAPFEILKRAEPLRPAAIAPILRHSDAADRMSRDGTRACIRSAIPARGCRQP